MRDRDTILLGETYDKRIQDFIKNRDIDFENTIPSDDDIMVAAQERNKILSRFKYTPLVVDDNFIHEAREFLNWAIKEKEEFDRNHPDAEIKYSIWSFLNENYRKWNDTGKGASRKNTSVAELLVLLVELLRKKKAK